MEVVRRSIASFVILLAATLRFVARASPQKLRLAQQYSCTAFQRIARVRAGNAARLKSGVVRG